MQRLVVTLLTNKTISSFLYKVGQTDGVNSRIRQSLNNYRAVKLNLYKNGDPWFGPINYLFLPGRDVTSLESLFKIISPKMDLMNGKELLFL